MARSDSTLDEVLTQVVARLIDQLDDATTSTCYMSLDPDRLPAGNPGDFIYVVTPFPSGTFPWGQDGGGPNQVVCQWPVVVTIHNTAINDEVGREEEWITNTDRGVVIKSTLVLKALVTHDLQDVAAENEILAQPIQVFDGAIDKVQTKRRGSIQFAFLILFDWDLS